MVASYDTISQIMEVVKRHVTEAQLRRILQELLEVPGSKSFRDTVQRLDRENRGRGGSTFSS